MAITGQYWVISLAIFIHPAKYELVSLNQWTELKLYTEREFFYYSDNYINIYNVLNFKHFVPSPIGLICHFKASICQCVVASTNKSRKMLHRERDLFTPLF